MESFRKCLKSIDILIEYNKKLLDSAPSADLNFEIGNLYLFRAILVKNHTDRFDTSIEYSYKDAIPFLEEAIKMNQHIDSIGSLDVAIKGANTFELE
ncbi:MAG: hypothetical protein LBM77_05700 [Spirochaetaceae bacterium]|jgi:hypothetical protein|nr:hypothetical protein [Spirochaetaceae bacterium]